MRLIRGPWFGPLPRVEVTRYARRGRDAWLRTLYAAALLTILVWSQTDYILGYGRGWDGLFAARTMRHADMAAFAASFFQTFMSVQFVAILLLTPAYVAGAIAEERERRTLEFLFVTALTDREIILGKLAGRLANLCLLLLTGLPILSLMELLGGIDPLLVLGGFLVCGMTMLALGAMSMAVSVSCRRQAEAIFWSYFCTFLLCFFSCVFCAQAVPFFANPGTSSGVAVLALSVGSLPLALLALVSIAAAISNLRGFPLPSAAPPAPKIMPRPASPNPQPVRSTPRIARPPVGDHALLWKEFYFEHDVGFMIRENWGEGQKEALLSLFLILSLTCIVVLFNMDKNVNEVLSDFFRIVWTGLVGLILVIVAMQAAGTICRERQKQTLDTLLTLPVEHSHILAAKLFGSILCPDLLWWLLGIGLVMAAMSISVHVLAAVLLLLSLAIFVTLAACIGLWCSTLHSTQLQANFRTVLGLLLLNGLPWLLATYSTDFLAASFPKPMCEAIERFLIYGLTPLVNINVLAFHYSSFLDPHGLANPHNLFAALAGLVFYALLTLFLWRRIVARFQPKADRYSKRHLARMMALPGKQE